MMSLNNPTQAKSPQTSKKQNRSVIEPTPNKQQRQMAHPTKNGFRHSKHDFITSNDQYELIMLPSLQSYSPLDMFWMFGLIHNNCLIMKQTISVDNLPSFPPERGARRPKIINSSVVFDSKSHHSLKKLMQLKMLPPLPNHPQTDTKAKVRSKNCPEEIHDSVLFQVNQPEMLNKSQELESFTTAKFRFDEVTLDSDRKNSTIELEVAESAGKERFKKSTQMGVTFGKVGRLEKHRYTEMQEDPPKVVSPRCKSKLKVPKINLSGLEKMDKSGFKLGRYESIFKPNSPKEFHTIDTIPHKQTRNSHTPILLARLKQKAQSLLPPILLRVQPHLN